MRTAGLLMMDTPMPDGRLMIFPADMVGGGVLGVINGIGVLELSGAAAIFISSNVSGQLLRYGMSDDAQQNFGMGAPGSLGIQGAQAQVITTGQPFTTPYGPSGRPPQPSSNFGKIQSSRPKGLKPVAVSAVYSVTGGSLTSLQVGLGRVVFTAGVLPAPLTVLGGTNLPLGASVLNTITIPIPVANQVWLVDGFTSLGVSLNVTPGAAATLNLYGLFIDFNFNYN